MDINAGGLVGKLSVIENINLTFSGFSLRRKKLNKDNVKILFVDDQDMPIANNLAKSGWNVKKIKDIKDINSDEVQTRHIIFIDFDGVGRSISSAHQGAGVVKELKIKYKKKKYIVLYTLQKALPSDTAMKSLFDFADERLMKNSDETEFTDLIYRAMNIIKS